jgi:hypothetical protein
LQPTDGEVQTISVSFPPPPPNKIKTKADQNALAFWKHLEIRRNAIAKEGACMREANEAILHLNHEFQLLTAPLSKSSLKDDYQDITEEEKEEEEEQKETKKINIQENDIFTAKINCNIDTFKTDTATVKGSNSFSSYITRFLSTISTISTKSKEDNKEDRIQQCFENTQKEKDYVFQLTGKVIEIYEENQNEFVKIELQKIESFDTLANKSLSKDFDQLKRKPTYSIKNDPSLLIWRTYKKQSNDSEGTNSSMVTATLQDVPDDGDCFFYALYRALDNRNLLATMYEKKTPTEEDFIKNLRIYLSKILNEDNTTNDNDNKKVESLKQVISQPKTWVSEIEVNKMKELLSNHEITLDIKNNNDNDHKWKKDMLLLLDEKKQRIVLVNEDNQHYKWYKFPPPTKTSPTESKGGKSALTLRKRWRRIHQTLRRR